MGAGGSRGLVGLAVTVGVLAGGAIAPGAVVSDAADPTWQTDGAVRAIAVSGNRIYIGGDFTHVRAPGAPAGGAVRNHLAALDATTGALLPWNPNANGRVLALQMKPGGRTIYAGGTFTGIGGRPRLRIAAIATHGGTARRWNPRAGARVDAIAVTRRRVYIGGAFASVGGVRRHGLAAISAAPAPGCWRGSGRPRRRDARARAVGRRRSTLPGRYFHQRGRRAARAPGGGRHGDRPDRRLTRTHHGR